MRKVRVSDLAERDLDKIWYYIAKDSGSIEIADRVVESISETFSLLAQNPDAGIHRDKIEPGVRGFPVGKYIVYYRSVGEHVEISRVIHGMRDQKSAFADED